MNYKDMTFCAAKDCANFSTCGRAYTDKVRDDATTWWGSPDFPIALFVGQPECFEEGAEE